MSDAFEVAAIGLGAQQRALDLIANNIANVNTPYFKRAEIDFSALISTARMDGNAPTDSNGAAGVGVSSNLALFQQGVLEQTGHAFDIAIDGAGFIEVLGPGGQSHLWRGGRLIVNEFGQLGTSDGLALRANITTPRDMEALSIRPDGEVVALTSDGTEEVLGLINLVQVSHPDAVEALDGGQYRLADDARLIDAVPGEDGTGRLVQGSIERSNVDLNQEMVDLMIIQRAFAANAQVVQAADQLMSIANNLRRG